MLKLADRYLLRELVSPFVLAILGFLIFFLLFLMGRFSQLLVDRVIPPGTLALMLIYQLPYLLVLALPVATLFAIFLALGRLGHDREIIALQASGIPLRRLITPLLIMGLFISGLDLLLNDKFAPWGNRQFLRLYVQAVYGGRSTPYIRDNAFFKGDENRFFYARHYDERRNILEDVLIYDLSGELSLQDSGTFPKIITSKSASWDGEIWKLRNGIIHTFDDRGNLRYKDHFEVMEIYVGETIQKLAFEQRSPSEMSLSELAQRIEDFRRIGRPAESLIVDYHLKIAIPLASFVFALFGAPLSLLIGPRGRALGIIISLLLVLIYQGILFLTAEIMGTHGDLPPAWGAHLPNMLFGLVGLLLYLMANRLGRLDILERAKSLLLLLPALATLIIGTAISGWAQETPEPIPIELSADSVTISEAWKTITAEGQVRAEYRDGAIEARWAKLSRQAQELWEFEAKEARFSQLQQELSGSALELHALLLKRGDSLSAHEITLKQSASLEFKGSQLKAERISLTNSDENEHVWEVEAQGRVVFQQEAQDQITQAALLRLRLVLVEDPQNQWRAQDAVVEDFSGETDFTNSRGETHRLRYQGQRAKILFNDQNQVSLFDVSEGDFTTCSCEEAICDEAYSIRAARLFIWPNEVLVAFNTTLRTFGVPVFWAPAAFAPLTDVQQKYPFIPEIGQDAARGWFAKWRIPLFFNEENFGTLLLDYYTRYSEVGSGIDLSYRALPGSRGGRLSLYRLVGRENSLALDWSESLKLSEATLLDLAASLRTGILAREEARLLSQAVLSGEEGDWSWRVGFIRDQNLLGSKPDPEALKKLNYLVLERSPELSLSKRPVRLWDWPLSYSTGFEWGRYHELDIDGSSHESSRFDGRLQARLEPITPLAGVQLSANSGFRFSLYELSRRESWDLLAHSRFNPLNELNLSLEYLYRAVHGQSPFRFDQLTVSNRMAFRGSWDFNPQGSVQFNSGYNWARGDFDPLNVSLLYHLGIAQTMLGLLYDLNRQNLMSLSLQAGASGEGWRLTANAGYDFMRARYEDLIAKLDLGPALKAGLRFDLNGLKLRRVNLESSWGINNWELEFRGEYDIDLGRFTALRFGVIKKFCHACWQIGFYGSLNQLWIQARINAFPAAEVGYSPTDQTLSFGR